MPSQMLDDELCWALDEGFLPKMTVPNREGFVILPDVSARGVSPHIFLHRSHQMAIKARSRREKVGGRLTLLLGIIVFNLIAPCCLSVRQALMVCR